MGIKNYFLVGFKLTPQDGIHVWYSKPGQEPLGAEVMDHWAHKAPLLPEELFINS